MKKDKVFTYKEILSILEEKLKISEMIGILPNAKEIIVSNQFSDEFKKNSSGDLTFWGLPLKTNEFMHEDMVLLSTVKVRGEQE